MIGVTRKIEIGCDGTDKSLPSSIHTNDIKDGDISNITIEADASSPTPSTTLTPDDCGMPSTPPSRLLIMPSEEQLEEGYDSDGNVGPFIDPNIADENLVSMDETTPDQQVVVIGKKKKSGGSTRRRLLKVKTIKKMGVLELRDALKKRGISIHGLKEDLVERLVKAVGEGVPLIADRASVVVENYAGVCFQPGSYWKEMIPRGSIIDDEAIMYVDGVQFRAPTTTAEEMEAPGYCRRPKKRNFSEIFNRGTFTSPPRLLPEKNSTGNYRRTKDGSYVYSKQLTHLTVPNLEYLFQKGISFDSHPADWFNLFPPFKCDKYTHEKAVTMDDLTVWLNVKAVIANAGSRGGKYSRFKDFTKPELMSHLSLYLYHALSPSPRLDMKFKIGIDDPINGSSLCN
jgi:hypothetical protein